MTLNPDRLLAEDETAWDELLDAIIAGTAPDMPEIVAQMIAPPTSPEEELLASIFGHHDFAYWVGVAQGVLERSEKHFTISGPLGKFRAWFGEQALAGMDPSDPTSWPIRRELISRVAADDGGLADATRLLDLMEQGGADPDDRAEVALLVVKGAFTTRDYASARQHAMRAMKLFGESGNDARTNFAQRRLAVGLLYLGEVELALKMFTRALTTRGPLFGGGGVQVYSQAPDPKTEAIDEARDISAWATLYTPEWVRAVGALALRWDDEAGTELLWRAFDALLDQLMATDTIYDDIEVVVRHASERGQLEVAERALRRYLEDFPNDEWATKYLHDLGRAQAVEAVKARWAEDPDAAIDEGLRLFASEGQTTAIAESSIVLDLADFLINVMLQAKDERAVGVQQALWDSKLDSWGECPAAWLEEQNLGTVYGELGQVEHGLALLASALEKQRAHYRDDGHPHVARTLRNIERVEAMR